MKGLTLAAAALIALGTAALAEEATDPEEALSPNQIVEAAPSRDWVSIPAEDLLVMTLAPDAQGNAREVIIQLMPAPFSQGWVENIRTLARADWYAGTAVTRVQDNYVVQWGDPHAEDETKAKPLPDGLNVMREADYIAALDIQRFRNISWAVSIGDNLRRKADGPPVPNLDKQWDVYAPISGYFSGWPVALKQQARWPVHCYGMVGVGRDYAPDTGSGAELYTVIGHAPRHLDRNIALVGRVIEGIEHLSSMTRGSGPLGFYTEDEADLRTPILSIRVVSDMPDSERPKYQYLSTESESFASYTEARANRRDPWFIRPAGGADICNIPVPVRRMGNPPE